MFAPGPFRFLLPILSLAIGLRACAADPVTTPLPTATFETFQYSGHDTRFDAPVASGEFQNPILAGFHPDPSVCRVGEDYYLANSSFTYFPGVPIFHSRDLVHWRQVGHVITRASQADFRGQSVSRGVFAPALSYHDGLFYLITTLIDRGGNCLFTARDPAGPWSDPIRLEGVDGIDPSLFFDADNRAWVVNNGPPSGRPLYDGHRAIWLQQFDPSSKKMVGPRRIIVDGGTDLKRHPIWIEGPHLFKRGDWYYLICAEGGTAENHSEVVFRSTRVEGPWHSYAANPILTQRDLRADRPNPVTCTGHAEFTQAPDGGWWAVFLGCRPYADNQYNTGRETFLLPVRWTADGWPLVLPPGEPVPVSGPAPKVAMVAAEAEGVPLSGNFDWKADFSAEALAADWDALRSSSAPWASVGRSPGTLTLVARPVPLSGQDTPSFLARRQQHASFDASTTLRLPVSESVSAGVVAFQNETHYFFLGVRRQGQLAEIFLERANGKDPANVVRIEVPVADRLSLQIASDGPRYRFAYSLVPGKWIVLRDREDGSILSTKVAGGFVGTFLGLYARLDQ